MSEQTKWAAALADAIQECLDAVDSGSPHDADSWITLEERLGHDAVKKLWNQATLGLIAKALDHFCHTAQHDRNVVFGDVLLSDVRALLKECMALLRKDATDFPEELNVFR